MDWAPTSDITLDLLIKCAGIRWRDVPLAHIAELVWPAVCGIHLMRINRDLTSAEKCLAIRHGRRHVLAGHISDMSPSLDGPDWTTYDECVADLFALADLVSDRVLSELRSAGYAPNEAERWLYSEIAPYAPSWPPERIRDRIRLRLALAGL